MGNLAIISDLHVDINQFGEAELMLLWEVLQQKRLLGFIWLGIPPIKSIVVSQSLNFLQSGYQRLSILAIMS